MQPQRAPAHAIHKPERNRFASARSVRLAAPTLIPLVTGKSAAMPSQINQGQRKRRNTAVSVARVNPSCHSGVVAINQATVMSPITPLSARSKGRVEDCVVGRVRCEMELAPAIAMNG